MPQQHVLLCIQVGTLTISEAEVEEHEANYHVANPVYECHLKAQAVSLLHTPPPSQRYGAAAPDTCPCACCYAATRCTSPCCWGSGAPVERPWSRAAHETWSSRGVCMKDHQCMMDHQSPLHLCTSLTQHPSALLEDHAHQGTASLMLTFRCRCYQVDTQAAAVPQQHVMCLFPKSLTHGHSPGSCTAAAVVEVCKKWLETSRGVSVFSIQNCCPTSSAEYSHRCCPLSQHV